MGRLAVLADNLPVYAAVVLVAVLLSLGTQVVHENPNTLIITHVMLVHDQVSTLVNHLSLDLDAISQALQEKNDTLANQAFFKFDSDNDRLKDLVMQMNVSGADLPALYNDLDSMDTDMSSLLNYTREYDYNLRLYNASVASGDSENASIYAARLKSSYNAMGMAYNSLYNKATSTSEKLHSIGVNTGLYESSISDLNHEVNQMIVSYGNAVPENNSTDVWLSEIPGLRPGSNESGPEVNFTSVNETSDQVSLVDLTSNDSPAVTTTSGPDIAIIKNTSNFTQAGESPASGESSSWYQVPAMIGAGLLLALSLAAILLTRKKLPVVRQAPVESPENVPPLPVSSTPSPILSLENELGQILADIESNYLRKAQKELYFLAVRAVIFKGLAINDSMTPREVGKAVSAAYPGITVPMSFIIGSYETAAFAMGDPGQSDVLQSVDRVKEIFISLNIESPEAA